MHWIFILTFILFGNFHNVSQINSPIIKKFSKIQQDNKFIISESIFESGVVENYITTVPMVELKKAKNLNHNLGWIRNIEWDENLNQKGCQITLNGISSIEKAFNNALTLLEERSKSPQETMKRIHLEENFLCLSPSEQSNSIIAKIRESLSSMDDYKVLIEIGPNNNSIKNQAYFLTTNNEKIVYPHIRAIYNWVFADQLSGWHNRNLILSGDRNESSNEIILVEQSIFEDENELTKIVMETIISNPNFENGTYVSF